MSQSQGEEIQFAPGRGVMEEAGETGLEKWEGTGKKSKRISPAKRG